MARNTIQYYYDKMAQEASTRTELLKLQPNPDSAQTFLDDINTPSKVGEHRAMMWIFAFLAWLLDVFQVQHETEVESLLKDGRYGTFPYYVSKALGFQFGDSQQWVNDEYIYSPIDITKLIIKYAAPTGSGKLVTFKIAKDSAGVPDKLTITEKAAFTAYIAKHIPPGITAAVISMDPDLLKLEFDIMYNPQIMTAAGDLISDNSINPVEDAINVYLNTVKFDSKFETVDIIDSIQTAEGVVRPYLTSCEAKPQDGTAYTVVSRSYLPLAGHMKLDPANAPVINYIANV